MNKVIKVLGLFGACLFLFACGGGGGSTPTATQSCQLSDNENLTGDKSGVILADSTEAITGTVSLSANNVFTPQNRTQGKFGAFSINADGVWSYSITNLASEYTEPEEAFTIRTCDGSIYTVDILVKGLYQRVINIYDYTVPFIDEFGFTLGDQPISVTSLYDSDNIQAIMLSEDNVTAYSYDEEGDISESTPLSGYNYVYEHDYEYVDGELNRLDRTRYRYDNDILIQENIYSYTHVDEVFYYSDFESYSFDTDGLNPVQEAVINYEHVYNSLDQLTEKYIRFIDSDTQDIEPEYEAWRLRGEYTYEEGRLASYADYQTLSARTSSGVRRLERYTYGEQARLVSKAIQLGTRTTLDDGSYLFSDVELDEPTVYAYNYIDELDVLVYFGTNETEMYSDTPEVFSVEIYEYEDVDRCGLHHQILKDIDRPFCRIKTIDASSQPLSR